MSGKLDDYEMNRVGPNLDRMVPEQSRLEVDRSRVVRLAFRQWNPDMERQDIQDIRINCWGN